MTCLSVLANLLPVSRAASSPLRWGVLLLTLLATPEIVFAQDVGEIVMVAGQVEVWRQDGWQAATAGAAVQAGDRLRTGESGRAAVQLANGMQIKLDSNSDLELREISSPQLRTSQGFVDNVMRVLNGNVWIRSEGGSLKVQTRLATATIRGTEFSLGIAGNDSAHLAVLEGRVEFSNERGSVMVGANELGIAKAGDAPRKTVLINPLDSVQWSLYYPGTISYRDYPLSGYRRPAREAAGALRAPGASADGAAWTDWGEARFDLGRTTEARDAFERAIALEPHSARALTGLGWVQLDANAPAAALADFERVRPETLMSLVGKANALYRLDRWDEADACLARAHRQFPRSPLPLVQAASVNLAKGRADAALQDLDRALALDPGNALALSLRSNVLLVQNRKDAAAEAAQVAVQAHPESPSAQLALSSVQQAQFRLDDALAAAERAVELDPDNAQALIQVSRLRFGMGQSAESFAIAEQARRAAPDDPLVNSTWAFLTLARGDERAAARAFEAAIEADSTRAEPHLGQGLIHFRKNRTASGVDEMRKATLLEPKVSLYESYLGKAYYEVDDDRLAEKHLKLAKRLDPRDPTPHFYDAVRLSAQNRPVEAVQELQRSIDLNDNRAVYRSRLLLDEDQAARGATMGRLYGQLDFDHLALLEGEQSLSQDPANYSGHYLLADAYLTRSRYRIGRASELLQSQLLQPLGLAPVRPQLSETDMVIPEGLGPTDVSLNEFSPLFVREGLSGHVAGVAGSHGTVGDEILASGLAENFSLSMGQFHYETDGFRENNDARYDIQNAIAQVRLTPALSLQAEVRHRESDEGDLSMQFDPEVFSTDYRTWNRQGTFRLGGRFSPSARSDVLASFIKTNKKSEMTLDFPGIATWNTDLDEDGYQADLQYLFRADRFNLVAGAGRYEVDRKEASGFDYTESLGVACPPETACEELFDLPQERNNAYLYSHVTLPAKAVWTLGLSYEDLQDARYELSEWNPKLGLDWNFAGRSHLRLAAFRTVKPSLVVEQTLEPTQVAGFNQFYDDGDSSKTRFVGIGLDSWLTPEIQAGIEATGRRVDTPVLRVPADPEDPYFLAGFREQLYRGFFYWMLNARWSLSAEPEYELVRRAQFTDDALNRVKTLIVPLSVRYTTPAGWSASLKASYVDQEVTGGAFTPVQAGHDDFVVLDAKIGYRLPRRLGTVSLEALNLLGQQFYFQDGNFQTSEAQNPRFIPDRQVYLRFSTDL